MTDPAIEPWMLEKLKAMAEEPTYHGIVCGKALALIECQQHALASAEQRIAALLEANGLRIIAGKNGKGFAYVRGKEYPVEGPGDGSRFATREEAIDAAIDAAR